MSCPICDEADQFIEEEKKNRELHLPGYNYCGPGTKVVTRIYRDKIKPKNKLDRACQIHDVEYMVYNDDDKKLTESDQKLRKAAQQYGGWAGFAVNNTFRAKNFLERLGFFKPSRFAKYLSNQSSSRQKKIGDHLYNLIQTNTDYYDY